MSSIPVKDVPGPEHIKNFVLEEWPKYRAWRGGTPPADLRCTSWAGDKSNNSPSHSRSRALDIVTAEWPDRRYLVEFAVWLAVVGRSKGINVIAYPRHPQPHLHVADYSGFTGKSDPSISVMDASGKATTFPAAEYAGHAAVIIEALKKVQDTYEKGPETDWEPFEAMLKGENVPDEGIMQKILGFLKKYWWAVLIPVAVLVVFMIVRAIRNRNETVEE